jgi:serine/threonine-protein kinase HipA
MVMGEGKNPGTEHLIQLGLEAKITDTCINEIIAQIKQALGRWKILAKKHGVGQANIDLIGKVIAGKS